MNDERLSQLEKQWEDKWEETRRGKLERDKILIRIAEALERLCDEVECLPRGEK